VTGPPQVGHGTAETMQEFASPGINAQGHFALTGLRQQVDELLDQRQGQIVDAVVADVL
jgi:hypothetical protein